MIRGVLAFFGLLIMSELSNFRTFRRMVGGRWATVTGYVYGKRWVKLDAASLERSEEDYTRRFRIADMDAETRKVIYFAHIIVRNTSPDNIGRLMAALDAFDKKHEAERTRNLLRGIFGDPQTTTYGPQTDAGRNESETAKAEE